MPFNLKKHAETVQQRMHEHHDELGKDERIGTTNRLLEKDRQNKDNSLISTELEKIHKEETKGLTEKQLDAYDGEDGISRRTGQDSFDQLPINLLEEKRHQQWTKAHNRAKDVDSDTEFWDDVLTDKSIDPTPSQLHNHPGRFKHMSEGDILKNEGVKQMVMASLADADAMVYHLYRAASDNGRELTADEKSLLERLSAEKVNVLSKLNA